MESRLLKANGKALFEMRDATGFHSEGIFPLSESLRANTSISVFNQPFLDANFYSCVLLFLYLNK